MSKRKSQRRTKFGSVAVIERGDYVRIRWRENKKTIERSKTDWTEACNFARQVKAQLTKGGVGSPEGTFAGVADAAMRRGHFQSWGDEAYENLRSILRIHIIPVLGSKKARMVLDTDCQALLTKLYVDGFSKHTVAKAKKVFGYIGKYGVKHGVWVHGQEPTHDLKMPRSKFESTDVQLAPVPLSRIPVDEQVIKFVTVAWEEEARYGFICDMARTCALRWSEIRGLVPESFDFEQRIVSVHQTRTPKAVKKTKTVAGVRHVVIAKEHIERIRAYVESQPAGQFLVQTDEGNTIASSNWSDVMKRLRKKSGYPMNMSLHSLRHYCGSKWRRDGKIVLEDISRMMGHANPSITQTLYLHSDPKYLDRVREVI